MIRAIELFNVGPFRGLHVIPLEAKAYAITATHESNPKKSNGLGKSTLLDAVKFAITGQLDKKREWDADGWITRGEQSGHVKVTLEDHAWIMRSKTRKQATQIRFQAPGHGEASQDGAALAILKHLRLAREDFSNAAYLEQREMAKLIHADPAEKLRIVSGWFGLGLAERAEKRMGEIAGEHDEELTKLLARRSALSEFTAAPSDERAVDVITEARERLREKIATLNEGASLTRKAVDAKRIVELQAGRIAEGKELRSEVDGLAEAMTSQDVDAHNDAAREAIKKQYALVAELRGVEKQKRIVSLGMFDGACPVAKLKCPATDAINAGRKTSGAEYEKAKRAVEKESAQLTALEAQHADSFEMQKELAQKRAKLDAIRERVRANADDVKAAKEILAKASETEPVDDAAVQDVIDEFDALSRELAAVHAGKKRRVEMATEIEKLDAQISTTSALLALATRGRGVMRAAQRRVAERALEAVEYRANELLFDANIDLRISARWEREAGGLAKSCEECGASFPKTRKVKLCEKCGAVRAPHTVQRLDFVLSDRSGALDDLGGISYQLSAGAWLLNARSSPWSAALIDEPFGACDEHNRRGLAVQLLKLLNHGTWRQAFVISHSPDTVGIFPGKLAIIVSADGTRRIDIQ